MEAVIAASQLCDEFGIDNMTAGITIGFAMECFERGLIGLKETDGIELRFGNDRAMIAMLEKLVRQEGLRQRAGQRHKDGCPKRSRGRKALPCTPRAWSSAGYECRGLNGQALQFAISARGRVSPRVRPAGARRDRGRDAP